MKIDKKEVMKNAVKLAKKMEGDWIARMKMALKTVWAMIKKGGKKVMEFIGSEKQIKWAKDIYPNAIAKIEEVIKAKEIEEYARKKEIRSKAYDHYIKFFEEMKEVKEASFWIEYFGYNQFYHEFIDGFHRYVESRKDEMEERIYNRLTRVMLKVSRDAMLLLGK